MESASYNAIYISFEGYTETQIIYLAKAESNRSQIVSFYGLCAANGDEARQEQAKPPAVSESEVGTHSILRTKTLLLLSLAAGSPVRRLKRCYAVAWL